MVVDLDPHYNVDALKTQTRSNKVKIAISLTKVKLFHE